jgi:hypothetical protein
MSKWSKILNAAEIEAHFASIAELDARYARDARAWYEDRTVVELEGHKHGCWNCNEAEGFMLAASFIALKQAA